MFESPKTAFVLELPVHLLEDYTAHLIECYHQHRGTHVVTLNSEMAMLAQQDESVCQAIREADLVVPDGAGIVFYLGLRGQEQHRCAGIDLAYSLVSQIGELGQDNLIAFYGGKPEVMEAAVKKWQEKIPQIPLIYSHGYLSPQETEAWTKKLQETQPRVILVGLGVPRQEYWIRQHRHLCPHAIWIGVGGSFDIWAGVKKRAPVWLQEHNLEWLYRLYQEPWRWRRMLALPKFVIWAVLGLDSSKSQNLKEIN